MLKTACCAASLLLLTLACTSAPEVTPAPIPAPEPAPSGAPCTEEAIEPAVLEKVAEASRGLAMLTELHCAGGFAKVNVGGDGLDTALAVLRDEGGVWQNIYLGTGRTPKEWCKENEAILPLERCRELMRPELAQ